MDAGDEEKHRKKRKGKSEASQWGIKKELKEAKGADQSFLSKGSSHSCERKKNWKLSQTAATSSDSPPQCKSCQEPQVASWPAVLRADILLGSMDKSSGLET